MCRWPEGDQENKEAVSSQQDFDTSEGKGGERDDQVEKGGQLALSKEREGERKKEGRRDKTRTESGLSLT